MSVLMKGWSRFCSFYEDPDYQIPSQTLLKATHSKYLLKDEEINRKIQALFSEKVTDSETVLSLLKSNKAPPLETFEALKKSERFSLYGPDFTERRLSLVLEHKGSGWIVKKNYQEGVNQSKVLSEIKKGVFIEDVPFYFYPISQWIAHQKIPIASALEYNPLRVVIAERLAQVIKNQKLDLIDVPKKHLVHLEKSRIIEKAITPKHPTSLLFGASLIEARFNPNRFVVVAEKKEVLGRSETIKKLICLSKENPNQLKKLFDQLATAIIETHLTDMHWNNITFLKDELKLVILDTEPVGGWCDESFKKEIKQATKELDSALFPLLGLKTLKWSLFEALDRKTEIAQDDKERLKSQVASVIDPKIEEIVNYRLRHYLKILSACLCPIIPAMQMIYVCLEIAFEMITVYMQVLVDQIRVTKKSFAF